MTPVWGRVQRGVVWHVMTGSYLAGAPGVRSWCGSIADDGNELHADPVTEENDAQPPRGARVCRRCCTAVDDFAHLVRSARVGDVDALVPMDLRIAVDPAPETYRGRLVEDVDLIGALDAIPSEAS